MCGQNGRPSWPKLSGQSYVRETVAGMLGFSHGGRYEYFKPLNKERPATVCSQCAASPPSVALASRTCTKPKERATSWLYRTEEGTLGTCVPPWKRRSLTPVHVVHPVFSRLEPQVEFHPHSFSLAPRLQVRSPCGCSVNFQHGPVNLHHTAGRGRLLLAPVDRGGITALHCSTAFTMHHSQLGQATYSSVTSLARLRLLAPTLCRT